METPWRKLYQTAPVTLCVLIILFACFLVSEMAQSGNEGDPAKDRFDVGLSRTLSFTNLPELYGPLHVWEGDWWRIPASLFYHVANQQSLQILYLLTSLFLVGWWGALAEPFFSKWAFLLFLLAGGLISLLPEFLVGNNVVGFSGVSCALLGFMIVLRKYDDLTAFCVSPRTILVGFFLIGLGLYFRVTDQSHFASLTHLTGLVYGWIAGELYLGRFRQTTWLCIPFLLAHLLVIPGLWYATQPIWIGKYHWYLAIKDKTPQRISHLQTAVAIDPSLAKAWEMLSIEQERQQNFLEAWKTILKALKLHRSNAEIEKRSRYLSRFFLLTLRREAALEILQDVFPDDSNIWAKRLELESKEDGKTILLRWFADEVRNKRLEWKHPFKENKPVIQPDDPQSASEGVTL